MIFILVSLLAHLIFVLIFLLVNHFVPKPELKSTPQKEPSTTIELEQGPAPAPPPPQHTFVPTEPDAAAPHKETEIESANDTRLKSKSTTARDDQSTMPDILAKVPKGELKDRPMEPSKTPPQPAMNGTKAQAEQAKATPQTSPKPTEQPQQAPRPNQPQPVPQPSKQPPMPKPAPKAEAQQFDPNGLPVLPALNAPTMAQANPHQQARPASSLPQRAADTHGAIGTSDDTSPEAMATELGKYEQRMHDAIGSRWYPATENQSSLIGVGVVEIHLTVHKDGTVETKVTSGADSPNLQMLLTISLDSIRESAPFEQFSPGLEKEVGDSFSTDYSFSIYGQ
jgi:hypothetical protein